MAVEVSIPQFGVTMEEGVLSEWLVEDGATVEAGEPIYVLETDKTESEIESPAAGVITIKAEAGGTYACGTPVAVIG